MFLKFLEGLVSRRAWQVSTFALAITFIIYAAEKR